MDIIGAAYGGTNPEGEFRAELEIAKNWLEGAMGHWEGLSEEKRLEMVAASLLSLHRVQLATDALKSTIESAARVPSRVVVPAPQERPNLVDLTLDETKTTARVKLVYRNEDLVGESPCRAGAGRDHAAPARATLEALDPLLHDGLVLQDARVLQIVDGPFAVVTLRNDDHLLVGSALIEDDLGLAMARATLDAANRFISGMRRNDDRTIQLQ